MRTAAIAKLKASLSEYLALVKAGEEVLITDRGKPVAKLSPIHSDTVAISTRVMTLAKAGLAYIGTDDGIPETFWSLPQPIDKDGMALKSLLEERSEER